MSARSVLFVALDILREALARRWFLALGVALTLIHLAIGLGLRLDVADGALAATRLFGKALGTDLRSAHSVLAPPTATSRFSLVPAAGRAALGEPRSPATSYPQRPATECVLKLSRYVAKARAVR